MSLGDTTTDVTIVETGGSENRGSYVDWGSIIAGAVLATAISFVLLTFGSALGLSLTSPYEGESTSLWGIAIAAGLWLLWVQVSAFMAGAYLTGRLRRRVYDATEHESDFRDGAHGLLVWGLGTLLGAFIAASTISGATTAASNAVGGLASAVGGIAAGAGNAADNPAVAGYVDRVFRAPGGEPLTPETREEVGRIFTTALTEGEFPNEDRDYVAALIADRSDISQEEARTRVDQVVTTAEQAEQQARDAAETARRTALIVGFFTAATLAIGAAAAFFAAGLGGRHRDEGVIFSDLHTR
jgi:hypothetical protein